MLGLVLTNVIIDMNRIMKCCYVLVVVAIIAIPLQSEAQLNRTSGLYGGKINAVIDGNAKYAVTPEYLYRYDADEEQWDNLKIRFKNHGFDHFIAHEGALYVSWNGGGEFDGDQVSLIKSEDQGVTWTNISPPNSDRIRTLDVAGDYMFVTSNGLELYSMDSGSSWQEIDYAGESIVNIIKTDTQYFMQTLSGLFKSDDGIGWEDLEFEDLSSIQDIVDIEEDVYVLTEHNEILKSDDAGISWTLLFEPTQFENQNLRLHALGTSLVLINSNSNAPDQFYFSEDTGQSWELVELQIDGNVMVSDSILYLNAYPDLLYSDDFGDNWQSINVDGLTSRNADVFEVNGETVILSPNYNFEYSQPPELNITFDGGYTWEELVFDTNKGSARLHSATNDRNGHLLAAAGYGADRYLYLSEDNGISWAEISNTVIHDIYDTGGTLVAAGDIAGTVNPRIEVSKFIISEDGGRTWNRIEISHNDEYVHSLYANDDIWLAAVNVQNPELYISDDFGQTWEQILEGDFSINSITRIGTHIYIGTSDGLKKGSGNGSDWVTDLPGQNISHLISSGRHLFYTIDDNLFQLDTETAAISKITDDEAGTINRLKIRGDSLYVASETGLWSMDVSELPTSILEEKELVQQVNLEQNYPNPFNPITTISFRIQQSENVELQIFDMLGRRVETLVNERRTAGVHTVSFDASGLSSGAYIYRLNTGVTSISKVLHLVK
jgi:photosystem II stability/assembly factor-like uncharacterized protein